jgi:acetyl esterase
VCAIRRPATTSWQAGTGLSRTAPTPLAPRPTRSTSVARAPAATWSLPPPGYLLDHKKPPPRALILAYASLHRGIPDWDPAELAAIREATNGTCLEPQWLAEMNLHYAGPDHMNDPAAFAGLGDPLPGHPPTFFLDRENDTVRPSAELFARQLTDAGVRCDRHLLTGASHGSLDRPVAPDGQEALGVLAKWIEDRS